MPPPTQTPLLVGLGVLFVASQFAHFGSSSGALAHSLALWGPVHFTHFGVNPQCRLEWSNFWQL